MRDLVISYQMGKVASSSIVASIPGCVQFHSWSGEEPVMFFSSRNTGSSLGRLRQHISWKYRFWRLQNSLAIHKKHANKPKLVIGVREPVSRAVSGYFQSLMEREKHLSISEHIDGFFAFCPHMMPLKWFDVELKRRLGIDVYQYEFDTVRGYSSFSAKGFEIFLYQTEKLDDIVPELGEFVGDDDLELVRVNEVAEKWSGDVYKKFLKEVCFPKGYLDLMYDSTYFRHFYGKDAEVYYRNKWEYCAE